MNPHLRKLTNHFMDVRLVTLASWRGAAEITPRDRGGPYVVLQEGYDPEDLTVTADEFVLGRSGKWLSLSYFFRLPVPERRAEYVFGTMAEVMQLMSDLPSKAAILGRITEDETAAVAQEGDEMASAIRNGKSGGGPTPAPGTT